MWTHIYLSQTQDTGEDEEDMGLAGAMAEDAEAEYIRKLTETDMVTGTLDQRMFNILNTPTQTVSQFAIHGQ